MIDWTVNYKSTTVFVSGKIADSTIAIVAGVVAPCIVVAFIAILIYRYKAKNRYKKWSIWDFECVFLLFVFLGQRLDLSRPRDIIGHVIIPFAVYGFL